MNLLFKSPYEEEMTIGQSQIESEFRESDQSVLESLARVGIPGVNWWLSYDKSDNPHASREFKWDDPYVKQSTGTSIMV
jgi:hypothetical protein